MPTIGANKRLWRQLSAEADSEVKDVLASLPAPLRDRVRRIPVILQPLPTRAMERDGIDPDLMGVFCGEPYSEEDAHASPPEIFLFLQNIWEESGGDREEYRAQVRDTLLHEIGHYLGLEEGDLADRGIE